MPKFKTVVDAETLLETLNYKVDEKNLHRANEFIRQHKSVVEEQMMSSCLSLVEELLSQWEGPEPWVYNV